MTKNLAPLIGMTLAILGNLSGAKAQEASAADDTPPPPCSGAEFRQLDFWVGDWDLTWTNADGSTGHGRNQITRNEYGDCVIYERFSSEQARGMSVSTYFAPAGLWRQTWVDTMGGYFALTGGPGDGGSVAFELRNSRLNDSELHLRMIWEDVNDDSLTWRWQSLPADGNPDTDGWEDRWVIYYSRRSDMESGASAEASNTDSP